MLETIVFFKTQMPVLLSIGLPLVVGYVLLIISLMEKQLLRKPIGFGASFPVRDAFIATIALDLYQVMFSVAHSEGWLYILIGLAALVFHVCFFWFTVKLRRRKKQGDLKEAFIFVRDLYLGLLLLVTNATSLIAIMSLSISGGAGAFSGGGGGGGF